MPDLIGNTTAMVMPDSSLLHIFYQKVTYEVTNSIFKFHVGFDSHNYYLPEHHISSC